VAEAVRDITSGKMASVVVEYTGTAPGMNLRNGIFDSSGSSLQ